MSPGPYSRLSNPNKKCDFIHNLLRAKTVANVKRSNAAGLALNRRPGRPPGSRNKISKAQIQAALENGDLMPLDYMLALMRDEDLPMPIRFEAAKAAAPFCHSKLASIQHTGALTFSHEEALKALA